RFQNGRYVPPAPPNLRPPPVLSRAAGLCVAPSPEYHLRNGEGSLPAAAPLGIPPRPRARGSSRAAAASLHRMELAVDHDPQPGAVVVVDSQPPQRPAAPIPPDALRHADRHRLGGRPQHPDPP